MRNIIGKNSDKNKQKNIFSINNKIISNSQVIAQEFNNFFVSIGPQLASNISSSTNHMVYMNTVANSIFIPDITTIEVINVILLLKNSCAGWDDIPAYVMKRCINVYIEPLTHSIDKSMKEGVFPSELKLAKVVPIFKSGDSSKITNYRPISVLSSQRYLNELCIIISLTLLTPLTFSINTNLDLDINTLLNRLSSLWLTKLRHL